MEATAGFTSLGRSARVAPTFPSTTLYTCTEEGVMATLALSPTLVPVLERVSPASQGIDAICLDRLYARIEAHIAAGWYPGAAMAMARHGKLVATRSFGVARLATASTPAGPAPVQGMR